LKIGTIEEHALLMASMFRAVKYEMIDEIYTKFKDKVKISIKVKEGEKGKDNEGENEE
jgi:hypothetical protein